MSTEPKKITSDDLYRFIHEPFSLPESRKSEILEAIESDESVGKSYRKLLKKAGFE